jgi:hypothetical protein
MAEAAESNAEELARDLDLSAMMFPGSEGETSRAALAARRAAERLTEARRELDRALPDVQQFTDDAGRAQLREDAPRQRETRAAAASLSETLAEGPDGAPLSPDAAEALGEVAEAMQRGERALSRGDPIEAAHAQEDAARRLTELREQLEQDQQPEGGGEGGGDAGGAASDFREHVRIPSADEFSGPMALRRRVLDAMRGTAPRGYDEAVRRYYEELLR